MENEIPDISYSLRIETVGGFVQYDELWIMYQCNGNAQAFVVALLAIVPLTRRAGAIGLALATMLKLHPALAVVWYAGRREWRLLAWYAAAMAVLTLVQLPWLPAMVRFYLSDPTATIQAVAESAMPPL